MITLVVGGDYKKRSLYRGKYLGEGFVVSSAESIKEVLTEITATSLFEEMKGVVFVNIFSGNKAEVDWKLILEQASAGTRKCIFEEEKTIAGLAPLCKKYKVEVLDLKEKEQSKYNPFLITDAYGVGDKKELFSLFMESLERGEAAEEIHGRIAWIAKTLAIVELSLKNKDESIVSEINPFVVSKTKRLLAGQKNRSFMKEYGELVSMYHLGHRGEGEMMYLLERFLLSV